VALAAFGEVEPAIELTRQALATEPLRTDYYYYYYLANYYSGLNRLNGAERKHSPGFAQIESYCARS
jgi:hypothetical protein